jgi:alpha-L-fucosidase
VEKPGKHNITVKPANGNKKELFRLRKIILQPVK